MDRQAQINSIIEKMSLMRDKTHLTVLKETLESLLLGKYADIFEKIYLFGSFARGDYRADSDIDILLCCNDKFNPRDGRFIRCLVARDSIPDVDLKFLTKNSNWLDGAFAINLEKEAVLIWKRN